MSTNIVNVYLLNVFISVDLKVPISEVRQSRCLLQLIVRNSTPTE